MEALHMVDCINNVGFCFLLNKQTFLSYLINLSFSIIVITVGFFISQFFANGTQKLFSIHNVDNTISGFLSALARYIVIIFTGIIALGQIGVQTNSIIAIIGAAGMAIGLALQGSLSNFAAGVLLILLRPLRTSEYVNLGNAAGTVLNVHIFYTTLKTLDGKIIVIPNGKIVAGNIINYSREPIRRNQFIINVTYDSDVDLVISVLQTVLDKEERVLKHPGNFVGLNEFSPSSLKFVVKCWCHTTELNAVYSDLMLKFKKALDQHNITIPCSKMDIYLYKKIHKILKINKKKIERKKK
ncbi:Small-conductance mechanosensitive channel [Buchnera aphidicola (Cinara cuneomaculata)]|uniref:Small-conductance mechanosensitive channel n=1 Tax=Buchnera aphidicola (Cinara cuneomaculata) TaxID=1660040 RepID=A0A451CYN8_9GAMM|nr:small-conductance mechanosensitive channel MscS [Buchnera aphidicola]VFP78268.1 Small-conductance mechanosensitive channel [Buchnera aphidicola (Cinara cuneomaculata)]